MTELEYLGVPATDLQRIRSNGVDDFGNLVVARRSDAGMPLRCCLRLSEAGEDIALIAFRPSALGGPYAEVGPAFIHTQDCPAPPRGFPADSRGFPADSRGFPAESSGFPAESRRFPADFRDRRAVLRPYDADGTMLDGVIAEPGESETELKRLFDDPQVALVQVRNVVAGCWNFSVRRSLD